MRALLLISCLVCLGCGPSSPYDYVEASGRVVYEDGTPIPLGAFRLLFTALDAPQVEGAHPRPGVAEVDDKGAFTCVTSYKYGDGLVPGRHKVALQEVKDKSGRLLVPKEFTNVATTPLEVNTDNAPFDIKVPKPTAGPAR
jgi:hypothetical protein